MWADRELPSIYLRSIYMTGLMMIGDQIQPVTDAEYIFILCVMVLGSPHAGLPPLHADWARPWPHLHRDGARHIRFSAWS